MTDSADDRKIAYCVDLDGTLVQSDLLHESTIELLKRAPFSLRHFPVWFIKGKAATKHAIAELVELDVSHLPFSQDVLALIHEARGRGQPIVLATAAAPQLAQAVAEHLGCFDMVVSSDASVNLSSALKAQRLVDLFGEGGFDYVGNAHCDLPVWKVARKIIVVSNDKRLHSRLRDAETQILQLKSRRDAASAWIKSLRVHQWLKNLLVFIPLLAAREIGDLGLALNSVLAFISFSLAASSVYMMNDLIDLAADRRHHRKRNRPFASGALPISSGVGGSLLLLSSAFLVALLLPPLFLLVLLSYVGLTSAYSFRLKRQVVVDVILLAALYTMRIIAGAAATWIVPSFWLLAFSMFIFLSLAMVKRYSELRLVVDHGSFLPGRGYSPADLPVLLSLGAASGMMSVLVLALYIDSPKVADLYRERFWLWLVPPTMLYWVARLWMKTHRGEVDEDPVVFAARDRQSLTIVVFLALLFTAAVSGVRLW